jgi:glycosyltransferase involved in cell wall biosynthesis
MRYSIIIPVHNEAAILGTAIPALLDALSADIRSVLGEVLLVENGSSDTSREEADRLVIRYPGLVRVLTIGRAGYGSAIRHGINQSTGTHLSILECDALSVSFLHASMRKFKDGRASLIVGSKLHPRAVDRRPLARRLMTRGFNLLLRGLLGYPGTDTHGLKSMETRLAHRLCELAICSDEVFQTELVLLAWHLGHPILELPIELEELRPTPVRILRRVPKVMPVLWELRQSLARFAERSGTVGTVVSG